MKIGCTDDVLDMFVGRLTEWEFVVVVDGGGCKKKKR